MPVRFNSRPLNYLLIAQVLGTRYSVLGTLLAASRECATYAGSGSENPVIKEFSQPRRRNILPLRERSIFLLDFISG